MSCVTYEVKVYDSQIEWCLNGKLHREDGPAVEYAGGDKRWYLNGQLHRTDGPAIEYVGGTKCWYLNGKLHHEDGPAVEHANGTKYWYLHGVRYSTEAEYRAALNNCDGKVVEIDGKKYRLVAV